MIQDGNMVLHQKEMKTMDGYIKIGINKEKVIYSENIQNYAQGYSYILQK